VDIMGNTSHRPSMRPGNERVVEAIAYPSVPRGSNRIGTLVVPDPFTPDLEIIRPLDKLLTRRGDAYPHHRPNVIGARGQ